MNFKNATMSSVVLGLSGLTPVIGAGVVASNAPCVLVAEDQEVSGSITAVGMDKSFTLTDAEGATHQITTNEKTSYSLDGEEATRSQVIVKGADVVAKVSEEGVALRVNRVTE
jgi:ABC-type phosphate transport system substrate-binding protein